MVRMGVKLIWSIFASLTPFKLAALLSLISIGFIYFGQESLELRSGEGNKVPTGRQSTSSLECGEKRSGLTLKLSKRERRSSAGSSGICHAQKLIREEKVFHFCSPDKKPQQGGMSEETISRREGKPDRNSPAISHFRHEGSG